MNTTTETLEFVLTLPSHVAEHLRDEVKNGPYTSANEFLEAMLESDTFFAQVPAHDVVEWANTEGVRRLNALEKNSSSGLTADQAFAGLINDE